MILPISNKVEHRDIFKNKKKTFRSQTSYPIPKAGAKFPEASMLLDYKHCSIRLAGLLIFARPSVFTSTVAVELAISRSVDHS